MLHRDIKPSNVLVDRSGRVVVCDFGLVTTPQANELDLAGTPAYMSPEQAARDRLTPASDFYSVGVMLYEALTGRLPVSADSVAPLLVRKCSAPIQPPRDFDPTISPQLEAICLGLLAHPPEQRPDTTAIRKALRGLTNESPTAPAISPTLFVGRRQERAQLEQALVDTRAGRTVAVLLSGPSGVGKSTLMAEFCQEARKRHGALVLSGRCYPTESVPFKAVDAIIDAIAEHLSALSTEQAEELLPDDEGVTALCELFPVLRRSTAVARAIERQDRPTPAFPLRSLAQVALGEILMALAQQRPLVATIDDLQWGDLDSEPFLRELIESLASPGILLLTTGRPQTSSAEGESSSPLLGVMEQLIGTPPKGSAAIATSVVSNSKS